MAMTKAVKCPKCGSTKISAIDAVDPADISQREASSGKALACSDCQNQWQPPSDQNLREIDELITVILPTIRNG